MGSRWDKKNSGALTTNSIFFANNFFPTKPETSIHSKNDTASYTCHLGARSTSYEWVSDETLEVETYPPAFKN